VAARIPVLKYLPVFKLLAVGELAFVARRHLLYLDSDERRRLTKLLRRGRAIADVGACLIRVDSARDGVDHALAPIGRCGSCWPKSAASCPDV
jgi:hypothetical protein